MARISRARVIQQLASYNALVRAATEQAMLDDVTWFALVSEGNKITSRLARLWILNSTSTLYQPALEQAMLTLRHLRLITKQMAYVGDPRERDLIYPVKHAVMELLVMLPESEQYNWQVGLATDVAEAVSLCFELHGRVRTFRLRLHWPFRQVTVRAQMRIYAKCGTYPPREVLPWY